MLPFFEVIKRKKGFMWMPECLVAFEDLKKYLLLPPMLSKSEASEVL